ncbi:MAG: hypothetical protein DRJ65_16595, partial [Acidobacteria bacterium]
MPDVIVGSYRVGLGPSSSVSCWLKGIIVEPLDIKPGIGIGSAVLGPSRDEICGVFGTPESIDHEDYGDGSSSETWFYCGGDLSLTFCSDEGHRLT